MAGRLTSKFYNNVQVGEAAICILVDGSGTITPKKFAELKDGLHNLVPHLSKASVQLIQYAANTKVECAPTKDTNTLKKAIKEMEQLRTGKYTKEAVQFAIQRLNGVTSTQKIIIIITDGIPKKGHEPKGVINSAPKDIQFFAIGVGKCDEDNLKAMSTNDLYASIDDYKEFKQFADMLAQNEASIQAEPLITIHFRPGPSTTTGGDVQLSLEIENLWDKPTPKGMQIHFMSNSYFEYKQITMNQPIPVGESVNQNIKFTPKSTGDDQDFPGKIEFKVTIGSVTQLGMVTVPTGLLRGDFTIDKTLYGTPINVMVLGRMGSGKSALLNALTICLSMSSIPEDDMFHTAPTSGHVTTIYTYQSIGSYLRSMEKGPSARNDYIPLRFYDCWGFSPEDYKRVGFQEFLLGKVRLGATREELLLGTAVKTAILPKPDRSNEIHVVLMVTPITSYMEPETIERLNEAMGEATAAGYHPLLVVTNIDTIDDAKELETHKVELMRKVTIDPKNIFYHKNYFHQKTRNNEIDLSSRLILRAIWNKARRRHLEIGQKICKSTKYPIGEDGQSGEEDSSSEDEVIQDSDDEDKGKSKVTPSKDHQKRVNATLNTPTKSSAGSSSKPSTPNPKPSPKKSGSNTPSGKGPTSFTVKVIIDDNEEVLKVASTSTYADLRQDCIDSDLLTSDLPMQDEEGNSLDPEDQVEKGVTVLFVTKKKKNPGQGSSRGNNVTVTLKHNNKTEKFTVKKGTLVRELRQQAREEVFTHLPEKGPVRQDGVIVGATTEVEPDAEYTL